MSGQIHDSASLPAWKEPPVPTWYYAGWASTDPEDVGRT
jgi:hypothetical protein